VVVTLTLGFLAGSLALVAFGLDSLIEVFASVVVLWHLGGMDVEGRSRRASRLVAAAFVVLGLYLTAAGVNGLLNHSVPARSPVGIGFLAATVVVMVVLGTARRRVGLALPSAPKVSNSTLTLLDGGLAAGVLLALVLDLTLGWWWPDPVVALLVAALATKEGLDGWREA
jgi:divalent metal cation (Fe/Co/Zn/Cd) transporter